MYLMFSKMSLSIKKNYDWNIMKCDTGKKTNTFLISQKFFFMINGGYYKMIFNSFLFLSIPAKFIEQRSFCLYFRVLLGDLVKQTSTTAWFWTQMSMSCLKAPQRLKSVWSRWPSCPVIFAVSSWSEFENFIFWYSNELMEQINSLWESFCNLELIYRISTSFLLELTLSTVYLQFI